jgi:hypothetical protein
VSFINDGGRKFGDFGEFETCDSRKLSLTRKRHEAAIPVGNISSKRTVVDERVTAIDYSMMEGQAVIGLRTIDLDNESRQFRHLSKCEEQECTNLCLEME